MRKNTKVSIIYVNYKSFEDIKRNVEFLDKHKPNCAVEIIVVDNESDKKLEQFIKNKRSCKYIKSPKNLGYSGGNNLGVKYAQGKYLLILNPDTILYPNTLDILLSFIKKEKKAAIVAPLLVNSKGKILNQISSKALTPLRYIYTYTFATNIFPNNAIKKEFLEEESDSKKPYEVEVVPGSVLMVRKVLFEKIGGFDEKFFLYFDDNDICDRVREGGYKIYKVPKANVKHDWKPAEGNKKLKDIFEKSRFKYFQKHYGFLWAVIVEVFSRKWMN